SLAPSVIGSCSVLAVSIIRWRHLKEQVSLLVQLSLADLVAALILMFTSAMNKVRTDDSVTICQYSLPLSLTFYLISFLLVAVYAWKSKNSIKGWRATPAEDERRRVRHQPSLVIYHKVGRWYEEHKQEALFPVEGDGLSVRRLKSVFATARNMLIVILFCWAPGKHAHTHTHTHAHTLFCSFQAASVSLQGFLNSLVYAWGRPNFTRAVLGESTPLIAYRHMAFFDESLKNDIRQENKTFL
uniref:Si:dkey-30c15.2 n=1 Tax=Hippocampus comes TaxID=109280 RepID=A0A3Q2Y492_HIPCM